MSSDTSHNGDARRAPRSSPDHRPWWQRSWGAALMLAGAALLMGAALTVWSEAAGLIG